MLSSTWASAEPPVRRKRSKTADAGGTGADSMPASVTDLIHAKPSNLPGDTVVMSDDVCVARLAQAIEEHDADHLEEVARLMARLAVAVE
jgi:hypothetical protein